MTTEIPITHAAKVIEPTFQLPSEETEAQRELTHLKRRFHTQSHADLKERRKENSTKPYLIEGLIPENSLGILAGIRA